jgi:hypothetical protein
MKLKILSCVALFFVDSVFSAAWDDSELTKEQRAIRTTYTVKDGGGYWWNAGSTSEEHSTDVFTCGAHCSAKADCRSFTHCEDTQKCLLMPTQLDGPARVGGKMKREGVYSQCYTYIPECWVTFAGKNSNPTTFKDSESDIRGKGYEALHLKPGCTVSLYNAVNYGGPPKEISTNGYNTAVGDAGSFALYKSTGWQALLGNESALSGILFAVACAATALICCVVCVVCPKCSY